MRSIGIDQEYLPGRSDVAFPTIPVRLCSTFYQPDNKVVVNMARIAVRYEARMQRLEGIDGEAVISRPFRSFFYFSRHRNSLSSTAKLLKHKIHPAGFTRPFQLARTRFDPSGNLGRIADSLQPSMAIRRVGCLPLPNGNHDRHRVGSGRLDHHFARILLGDQNSTSPSASP